MEVQRDGVQEGDGHTVSPVDVGGLPWTQRQGSGSGSVLLAGRQAAGWKTCRDDSKRQSATENGGHNTMGGNMKVKLSEKVAER